MYYIYSTNEMNSIKTTNIDINHKINLNSYKKYALLLVLYSMYIIALIPATYIHMNDDIITNVFISVFFIFLISILFASLLKLLLLASNLHIHIMSIIIIMWTFLYLKYFFGICK